MHLRKNIEAWSTDRSWFGRALLLAWFLYLGYRYFADPSYSSPFSWLNLVSHEVGHPLFSYFGEWMHVAGGTLLQLAVPVLALAMFLSQGEYFGIPFCGVWLSTNLYGIALYIADARTQTLPLVTLGVNTGEPVEVQYTDWEYLLEYFNVLSWDTTIASYVRAAAFVFMWGSIVLGIWIVWVMAKFNKGRS